MNQPNIANDIPKNDRGKLNTLRNILASTAEELRQQEPIILGIIKFTTQELPKIIRDYTPLNILPASHNDKSLISPYPFEIHDLIQTADRPPVFDKVSDLIKQLDINTLAQELTGTELIGIDESQIDHPMPHRALTYLKSIAFRMYTSPEGKLDEAVGPVLSEMRMQLNEDETFEAENRLLGYIRNNFVAYVSALTSICYGRKPFIVLHGPLMGHCH